MPLIAAALQAFLEHRVHTIAPAVQPPPAAAGSLLPLPSTNGQDGTMSKHALEEPLPIIATVPGDKLPNGGFVMTPCPQPLE